MGEASNKRAIPVGIFIVIGLGLLIGGVLTIGNLRSTFQKKMTVTSYFEDVNGLQTGNNIWFSGVKIGTVKEIQICGKSQVKVILNINIESKKFIRKDSKVKISTDGLIGNKILVIYGGSHEIPEVEEGDILMNENLLATDDIMETFQENNLNILKLTKQLADGKGTIGRLINSDSLYNSIFTTAKSIQLASNDAQRLINSLNDFSNKLNKNGTLANDLVTDTITFNSIQASVSKLEHVMDTIAVLVTHLKEASNNTNSPVGVLLYDEKSGTHLKKTIENLEGGSENLKEDLKALQHNVLLRKYFKKDKTKKNKRKNKEAD